MADSAHSPEPTLDHTTSTQAHEAHGHNEHEPVNPMEVNGQMVLWTWIIFVVMLAVLYKIAWKPILGVLDQREKDIQDSIDNAATIRDEMISIDSVRAKTISDADEKSKAVLEAARNGAKEQAQLIEDKARDEALIITENASRDIEAKRANAEDALRLESANWAISLASKLVNENLDDEKNRALTDQLIKEL